jgi:hypothetical protein
MNPSTAEQIRALLDHPRGKGMVVSCYADTSVSEGHRHHWRPRLEVEARRIREALAEGPAARLEFDERAAAIREILESPEARRAKGMAVFCGPGTEAIALPAAEPYEDRIDVGEAPYLIPLLEAESRRRGYLAVETDTHRGRIYAASPGEARLLAELDEQVPAKQRSSGECWGWNQSGIARHHDELVARYWDDLVLAAEREWDAGSYRGIVLIGEDDAVEGFRGRLPARLAGRVVRRVRHAWFEDGEEVSEIVGPIAADAIRDEREVLLAEAVGRKAEGCAVAAGPQEVLVALRDGQVAHVLLGPDPGEAASRCAECGSPFVGVRDACPYCKSPCERVGLWQEIASVALRRGVAVHFAGDDPRLAGLGGVAALLARDAPQWA